MQKRHRFVYFASVLVLTLVLALSTIALLHFLERASPTHHMITFSLYGKQFSEPSAVRIMPLGDSITAGVGTVDRGGYREPLWKRIEAARWNVSFVGSQIDGPGSMADRDNEGHPGWRTDQISQKVVGWLEATQPQIILLHIGTNDIIQGYSSSVAASRLVYLLDQITNTLPDASIIVAQIIPLGRPLLNPRVVAYDRLIPLIVRDQVTQGKHVSSVDMYDSVPVSDLMDGIHPDAAGYALMANVWYQALKPMMEMHRA